MALFSTMKALKEEEDLGDTKKKQGKRRKKAMGEVSEGKKRPEISPISYYSVEKNTQKVGGRETGGQPTASCESGFILERTKARDKRVGGFEGG